MVSDTQNSSLFQKLADSGLRATPQREIVYQVLLDQRDHPTADEVFSRVKALMPTISLATVYNCLDTLVGCHLVKQVNFERGPSRYCPNLTEHAHFHDEVTGRIVDVDLPAELLAQLRALLPTGYQADAIELNIRGRAAR
jgi:Fur family transcriptional regulator, peroxide stress response regulator